MTETTLSNSQKLDFLNLIDNLRDKDLIFLSDFLRNEITARKKPINKKDTDYK